MGAPLDYLDLKWIALITLIVQNSGLAIAMRYTYLHASKDGVYIASTAVLLAELLKFCIALVICFVLDCQCSLQRLSSLFYTEFVQHHTDLIKLTIPSILYTLQNSLQYYSMSCLSAPIFQVLYQMKIITTAIFSVVILAKSLSNYQWISILTLTIGVALVQLSQSQLTSDGKSNSIAGFISVIISCVTSGFAGVYFELVLKSSNVSIWFRNIQLSAIGIILSIMSCVGKDGNAISERGMFVGYNSWVIIVIILQAAGGLLVAVVVKYADNVLKGFATSLSIVLSCIVSAMYFHDVEINQAFTIGGMVVLASVYTYGVNPPTTGNSNIVLSNPNQNIEDALPPKS